MLSPAPKWTPATKRVISVICLVILGLTIWHFSLVLAPLVLAVIIAFLLNPFVNWLTDNTRLNRSLATTAVYILFLFFLVLIPTIAAPLIVQQITEIDFDIQDVLTQLDEAQSYEFVVGGLTVNISSLAESAQGSLGQAFSPLATGAANLAVGIAGGFIWTIFILVVGFYLLLDANRFSEWVDSWIPRVYFQEFTLLREEINAVWRAYFRGQLILAMLVGLIVSLVMSLLGIRSALLLGFVAALLELIPNWGYSISAYVGIIFALFQGSSYLPVPNWVIAAIVALFYFVMWQIDTNYLVPRIIGTRLKLQPAIIIIGIIAGASVGGALGLLLAAPTIATLRVIGSYLYRRLLDLEPYVVVGVPPPLLKSEREAVSKRFHHTEEKETSS